MSAMGQKRTFAAQQLLWAKSGNPAYALFRPADHSSLLVNRWLRTESGRFLQRIGEKLERTIRIRLNTRG